MWYQTMVNPPRNKGFYSFHNNSMVWLYYVINSFRISCRCKQMWRCHNWTRRSPTSAILEKKIFHPHNWPAKYQTAFPLVFQRHLQPVNDIKPRLPMHQFAEHGKLQGIIQPEIECDYRTLPFLKKNMRTYLLTKTLNLCLKQGCWRVQLPF